MTPASPRILLLSLALLAPLAGCGEGPSTQETAAGAPSSEQAAESLPGLEIPRREKVAGMWGAELWTAIEFPGDGAQPHRLQTLLAFPGRTRFALAPARNPLGQLRLVYQYGERYFVVEPGSRDSSEFVGDGLRDQARLLSLRRALLVPEELEWTEVDGIGVADLGENGRLEAHGRQGHPERLVSYTAAGELSFELNGITWSGDPDPESGRAVPASWTLHHLGELIWSESLESFRVLGGVHSSSFLPRDRRIIDGTPAEETYSVGKRGPCWVLQAPLAGNGNWDDAEVQAELAAQTAAGDGRAPQRPLSFVVRADGRIGAARLVLPADGGPHPAPWIQDPGSTILEVRWGGSDYPVPRDLRALMERVGAEARKRGLQPRGSAFLHRMPDGGGLRLVQDVSG